MPRTSKSLPCWNLNDLYPGVDSKPLKQDLQRVQQRAAAFSDKYANKINGLNASALAGAIAEYEEISEILGRLSSYAYLLYAQEMSHEVNARFYQNISEQVNNVSSILIFFTLEINKIEDETLARMLAEDKKLAKYTSWLRDVRVHKPHQLSQELETLLHEKSLTGDQAWTRLYDETLAGLVFPIGGKKLSISDVLHLLSDKDARKRKAAALSLSKVFSQNARLFTMIMNTLVKDKAIEDGWRSYKQPISSRNVSNLIEDDVVEALNTAVKSRYAEISHRYYKLKAKWLGKKKLEFWDRNAPLPADDDRNTSWEEAVNLVLSAYQDFSPTMADVGKKFFDNDWIDVPPRAGKDSGAFAHPTVPGAHPYLLLNYHGKTRDVMTLAHELGHGVHQYLSYGQGYLMADTPLTLAETASVFGEQLVFRKLLAREKKPLKRAVILANKIEDMINTVIRQTAFCEFEQQVHAARKQGELSSDQIADIWMNVQRTSLGSAFNFTKEYRPFWMYISHFIHSPFYVYAYAFGDCLVNALYGQYLSGGVKNFEQKYIEMLKAGGTLRHKELLAPFGLDATTPDFWHKGLDVISHFIDELQATLKEIKS